jgi:hypothetical protein
VDIATALVTALLALALGYSAARKLTHRPEVVQTYTRVGVPEERLDQLAAILLAGALGLVVGLFWPPIGVAAGVGILVYFAVAIAAHFRANDVAHAPTPIAIEAFAVAALALRIASL